MHTIAFIVLVYCDNIMLYAYACERTSVYRLHAWTSRHAMIWQLNNEATCLSITLMYLFVCLLICPSTNRSVYLFVCFSTFLASMINIHNAHIGVFWHDLCWSTHLLYFDTFSLWRLRSLVPFWTCLNHNTHTHIHILVALTICASLLKYT